MRACSASPSSKAITAVAALCRIVCPEKNTCTFDDRGAGRVPRRRPSDLDRGAEGNDAAGVAAEPGGAVAAGLRRRHPERAVPEAGHRGRKRDTRLCRQRRTICPSRAGSLVPEVAPDQLGRLLLVGPEQVDDAVSKAEGRGREED